MFLASPKAFFKETDEGILFYPRGAAGTGFVVDIYKAKLIEDAIGGAAVIAFPCVFSEAGWPEAAPLAASALFFLGSVLLFIGVLRLKYRRTVMKGSNPF